MKMAFGTRIVIQEDRLYMLPQATMNYKNDQHVIRVLMDRLGDSQRVVLNIYDILMI